METRSLSLSILLHTVAVLFIAFGLPAILPPREEPMPMVMTVELLPISEISNVKPSDKAIQEDKKAQTVKNTKPLTPAAPEKPKAVEEKEPEKPKFNPMDEAEPLPDKPKKEEPKKEEPKKEEPKDDKKEKDKKKSETEFKALLDKMIQDEKARKDKDAKDKQQAEANKTKSDAPHDDSLPLSVSETDMIRSQFIPCWTMPAGAKDAHTLAARVKVKLQADGTVLEAVLAPDQLGRYNSDQYFKAAADSAVRAVYKCKQIKNLPPEKYNTWKEMEINFNPADMM